MAGPGRTIEALMLWILWWGDARGVSPLAGPESDFVIYFTIPDKIDGFFTEVSEAL